MSFQTPGGESKSKSSLPQNQKKVEPQRAKQHSGHVKAAPTAKMSFLLHPPPTLSASTHDFIDHKFTNGCQLIVLYNVDFVDALCSSDITVL